jgi:hypothetical protein
MQALRPYLLAAALLACAPAAAAPGFSAIDLTTAPIERFRIGSGDQVFGPLRFRGGLVIDSDDPRFGALSGLDIGADGKVTAVADTGYWFSADLVETDGRLTGMRNGRMAKLLDPDGNPLSGKRVSDAEGLRIVRGAGREDAYVSFEQINVVRRYRGPDFARAKAEPVKVPLATAKLPRNEGLEAIAMAPKDGPLGGAMLLFAEHALNGDGNHRAFIVGGPRNGTFAIAYSDEFNVTDAAFLPGGDLLILERRFSYTRGVALRLRRIAVDEIRPGATVEGETLLDANMSYQIDNMEAVSARVGPNGETIVNVMSDDNKSLIQRTILLQFVLDGPPAPALAASPQISGDIAADAAVPASASAAQPPLPRPHPRRK